MARGSFYNRTVCSIPKINSYRFAEAVTESSLGEKGLLPEQAFFCLLSRPVGICSLGLPLSETHCPT